MNLRALSVAVAAVLVAVPSGAAEMVFLRGTFDGAIVRVPRADASRCEVLRPAADRVVLVVQGIELAADSYSPRIEGIASMSVLGPGVLGKDESRVLLKLTTSRLVPRLVSEADGVALYLEDESSTARRAEREQSRVAAEAARAAASEQRSQARSTAAEERAARDAAARTPPPVTSVPRAESEPASVARTRRPRPETSSSPAPPPASSQAPAASSQQRAPRPAPPARERAPAARQQVAAPVAPLPEAPLPRPGPTVVSVQRTDDGMLHVPAGPFVMGSADGSGFADEGPEHVVMLAAFNIDATEVTVGDFERSELTLPRQPEWNWGANHPVVNVTWNEAVDYCASLGRRLPTEAEWEKAARGPNALLFPWGDSWNPAHANSGLDGDTHDHLSPAGTFPLGASPYGADDMAGNAWEWVADWYSESYYATAPAQAPPGPDHGTYRVARGGSFEGQASVNIRTTVRLPLKASSRRQNVGFRCAR